MRFNASFLLLLTVVVVDLRLTEASLVCKKGFKKILKPEGAICLRDFSRHWRKRGKQVRQGVTSHTPHQPHVLLPNIDHLESLGVREAECLSQKMLYWPHDQRCHQLLQQGPCEQDEWLVLERRGGNRFVGVCRTRPCPCTSEEPHLCEVQLGAELLRRQEDTGVCHGVRHCLVATAAEQDGVCGKGEMLHISPFGHGFCGCREHHVRVPGHNGGCHRLMVRGNLCPHHHILQLIPITDHHDDDDSDDGEEMRRARRAVCVPSLCENVNEVLNSVDGRCYQLFTKGPCANEEEVWLPDKTTGDPVCRPRSEQHVKRVFDLAPNVLREARERNSILNHLRAQMNFVCHSNNNSCRGQQTANRENRDRGKKSNVWKFTWKEQREGRQLEKIKQFMQWIISFQP